MSLNRKTKPKLEVRLFEIKTRPITNEAGIVINPAETVYVEGTRSSWTQFENSQPVFTIIGPDDKTVEFEIPKSDFMRSRIINKPDVPSYPQLEVIKED